MKTFQDIIDSSNPDDVIKKYTVNGTQIKLKASNLIDTNSVISDSILCTIEKINDILLLKFSCYCSLCEGTGQYDCEECNGDGDTECYECGTLLTCDYCKGDGVFDCDCEITEDEIIFEDEIDLNQGELFNSHFNK